MGIEVLFLFTVVALVVLGYVFLQWLGGKKPKPTMFTGESEHHLKSDEAELDGSTESSDGRPPNAG